jgi:hypothetical protein
LLYKPIKQGCKHIPVFLNTKSSLLLAHCWHRHAKEWHLQRKRDHWTNKELEGCMIYSRQRMSIKIAHTEHKIENDMLRTAATTWEFCVLNWKLWCHQYYETILAAATNDNQIARKYLREWNLTWIHSQIFLPFLIDTLWSPRLGCHWPDKKHTTVQGLF